MASCQLESSFLHYFGYKYIISYLFIVMTVNKHVNNVSNRKNGTRRGSLKEMMKDLPAGILKINVSRLIGEEIAPLTKFLNDRQVMYGQVLFR